MVQGTSVYSVPRSVLVKANTWLAAQTFDDVFIADDKVLVLGHSAQVVSGGGLKAAFQILGDTGNEDQSMLLAAFTASGSTPSLKLARSRGALGTPGTAVNTGDQLGVISAYGDDGTDIQTTAAQITFLAEGTIAENQIPGVIRLRTANASGALTSRLRIDSLGALLVGSNSSAGAGASNVMIFVNGAAETTQKADSAAIFAKDVGGVSTMHSQDEAETEVAF